MANSLPTQMRALVCEKVGTPLVLKNVPVPQPTPGSVVVKVLNAGAAANIPKLISGQMGFTFPTPFVPGTRGVGRVVAVGPDATSLAIGQLVLLEPFFRARDDGDVQILCGAFDGGSERSAKFMADNWPFGFFAEYARLPMENAWAVNEARLCGELGYDVAELSYLHEQAIGYAGLRAVNAQAGETVLIAPATGGYSGAAVTVAVAMGARVIAVGRNLQRLETLKKTYPTVNIVQLQGDSDQDLKNIASHGPIDVFLDISPPAATGSTHLKTCLNSLKPYGRANLLGMYLTDSIPIPYTTLVFKNITVRGGYMYERDQFKSLIKLAESGVLKLGKSGGQEVVGRFKLEEAYAAFEAAGTQDGIGKIFVIEP